MERIICLLIGYLFGCFLTAAVVVRKFRRVSVFTLGTGNPGMANVMAQCGLFPGILVLIGDLAKCFLAFLICFLLFREKLGTELLAAYAGLGAAAGHDFPFWHRFQGGKGVSCTCAALFCIHPLYGLAAMIAGLVVVLLTKYLSIGAVVIPAVFLPAAFLLYGKEVLILCLVLTGLMALKNAKGFFRIAAGTEEKIRLKKR